MIRFREYPLRNTPNMVAMVLRGAERGPVTRDGCVEDLLQLLSRADEHPPFGRDDVATRLEVVLRNLSEARLLAPGAEGYALTPRGRAVLADHPEGFDAADMMAYPEFSRYVHGLNGHRKVLDTRVGGYDRGYAAYWSGQMPGDNPFASDTADHLAWENGWSEALDEDHRPAP